jgi:hypothetical protein
MSTAELVIIRKQLHVQNMIISMLVTTAPWATEPLIETVKDLVAELRLIDRQADIDAGIVREDQSKSEASGVTEGVRRV